MFFEKTAAFAFADIYMGRHIIKRNLLAGMLLQVGDNFLQAGYVFDGAVRSCRQSVVILVKLLPDGAENEMNLHFKVLGRTLRKTVNLLYFFNDRCLPFRVRRKGQGIPALIFCNKIHVFCLKQAVLISVDEARMKCDRQIPAFPVIYHIACMESVAVGKQSLTFRQDVAFIIYQVFDLSGNDPGKFDFRMPVPHKGSALIRFNGFRTDTDGKTVISVIFDLSLIFFCINLHRNHQNLNILIIIDNIVIAGRTSAHYNHN